MNQAFPAEHQDLRKIAEFLDSKFRLPGGFRIGWDGIIGFIPVVGDLITNSMSIYIIVRAAMMGCFPAVVMRMGLNVLLDNLFDLVPIFGNFFDLFWKSNLKNIELLARHHHDPASVTRSSKILLILTLVVVISLLIGSVALIGWVAIWVWNQLMLMLVS